MKINKNNLKKVIPGALFAVVLIAVFFGGFYAGKNIGHMGPAPQVSVCLH